MHVAIASLVLIALLLTVGDASRSLAAGELQLMTFGEMLKPIWAVAAGGGGGLAPAGHTAGPLAEVIRVLLVFPAVLVVVALVTILRLVRWPFRRAHTVGGATAIAPHGANPLPARASDVGASPGPMPAGPMNVSSGARQEVTAKADAGPLRTIVEAPPAQPANPLLQSTRDRDFLPAALEILVTPPSPAATAMTATICGAFLAALVWGYFGWLDIHAIAIGKVQPSGRSKVVQPLEPGKVVAIRVENGATVNAGDILLELDTTETGADREALARDLEAASAEVARRTLAIAIAGGVELRPRPIAFDTTTSEPIRRREEGVLAAELGQLRSAIASLRAQLAEKRASTQRLDASIAARQRLIALAQERVDMRKEVETRGAGSRALIIDALQQYESYITTDVGERGQLEETQAAAQSLERKIEEAVAQFVADQTQKLAEIERRRDRLVQELVKAQSKNDRTQLRAPISGTVQQLAVTTVGQVVASGQSLLTVVPLDGPIEVEALITNKDIGFVEVGQAAIVKVDAFPFTRFGTIDASVAKVSRDAVDERASGVSSDVTNAVRPQAGSASSSPQAANLVFPATLALAQRTIRIDGKEIPLMPGMSVVVEVKTGRRRAIDYFLSPLREIATQSGHER